MNQNDQELLRMTQRIAQTQHDLDQGLSHILFFALVASSSQTLKFNFTFSSTP